VTRVGYLLFELLVVLVLIAIVALATMGTGSWQSHQLLRYEVDTLYYAIIAASQRALCRGTLERLSFPTRTSWRSAATEHTLAESVTFGTIPQLKGPPSHPVTTVTDPISFVGHGIICYPNGQVQPGTVYFTDEQQHVYAITCPVSSISYMRRYRYVDGRWERLP